MTDLQEKGADHGIEAIPRFREGEFQQLWSAQLVLDLPFEKFLERAQHNARAYAHPYKGFITRNAVGNVASFTYSAAASMGIDFKPIEQWADDCALGMELLASGIKATLHMPPQDGIRAVLTLPEAREGSLPLGISDLEILLPDAHITAVETFSVEHIRAGTFAYAGRPAVAVETSTRDISHVYNVAEMLELGDFTVENFFQGTARRVETRFAKPLS